MPGATARTTRAARLLGGALVVLGLVAALPASGQGDLASLREERRRVQAERAAAAAQVDVQQAEVGELAEALAALQAQVTAAEVRLADAERRLADARARAAELEQAVAVQQARIADLEDQLARRAVESFVGNRAGGDASLLDDADLYRSLRMRSLVDAVTENEADVAEQLAAAREDLQVEEAAARQAREEAAAHQLQVEGELAALDQARDEQARLIEAADARLDRLLGEAQALAALEGRLGEDIARAEAEEARRLAEAQAAAAARARAAAAARASSGGGGGGGGGQARVASAGEIVNVRGIWVHRSIASQLEAMLAAAAADGHHFGGGGYRDPSDQLRVRRANCGTSDYAVYQMPPSACSPPTARPGTSNHERGLAIDFVYEGSVIGSRSSPGYRWLAANAARYGFHNLPSEPWHWSVDGR